MEREIDSISGQGRLARGRLSCGHEVALETTHANPSRVYCDACAALQMPADCLPYKVTPLFTAARVPAGLLKDHSTKRGVWGRILVVEGRLRYHVSRLEQDFELSPGTEGVIPPEDLHYVEPLTPDTVFKVQFLRVPDEGAPAGEGSSSLG